MRPTLALTAIDAAMAPHLGGHRCTDGKWFNDATGTHTPCPTRAHLTTAREQVLRLHASVHDAAHNTEAATAVAEGMTGLVMADLSTEDREGWVLAARMAVEALAAHLDRDPVVEARARAVRGRLAAAGLPDEPATPPFPDAPTNTHAGAPWEAN